MAIRFRCPCGQKLKTRDGTEGGHAKCSLCQLMLRVPHGGLSTYETVAEIYTSHRHEAPPADAAAPEGVEIRAAAESPKARILVAESDASDRRAAVLMLRNHNYVVLEASDGPKALEIIRTERPAAALLNVRLDVISGFQVVQQLRSTANALNAEVWDTPVLMTTERVNGRDKQYSMSIGAHGYFQKPLKPAEICPKLEKIASKYLAH